MDAIVRIGTSGWSYEHWRRAFYPEGLAARDRLAFYAARFNAVEVNSTFYRLPTEATVRHWAGAVPAGFAFAVKGSRFITHVKRLQDVEDAVDEFFDRIALLGPALAVVLWQLPPDLPVDLGRLSRFMTLLPRSCRHAIEFRHPSWFSPPVHEVLREHDAALVCPDSDRIPAVRTATTDLIYLRFHGRAQLKGRYDERALAPWVTFVVDSVWAGRAAYAFFNNDFNAYAPADAVLFERLVRERLSGASGATEHGCGA